MGDTAGRAPVGSTVRRYCRARLAPVRGVAYADRLANAVVRQVADDDSAPFGREAYRAAVRAVDQVLTPPPLTRPPVRPAPGSSAMRLAAAVEELPAPMRDVLVLRTLVGLTRDEVADALGVSDRTVLRRQHEALRRLRRDEA